MGMYAYRAVSQDGAITNGHLPAINQRELDSRLQAAGLELIKARAVRQSLFFRTRIPSRELINFCLHMETTLNAGLMITDALEDQAESVGHRTFRDVMLVILQAVREGSSLSRAMQAFPDVFNEVFVGMVFSGEESGRLSQAFQKLGESLRWQDELSSQMKRMIMYPAFTVAVLLAVTVFILIYLVPELALFIRSMSEGDLPLQTWVLLRMSDLLRTFWLQILLSPFVLAAVIFVFLRVGGAVARHTMDSMKLRIPVIGRVIKMIILSRFSSLMAMLYESGVPIIQAMETARDAAGNRVIAAGVQRAITEIEQGKGITDSFAATGLFPNLMLRMIRIGEISGEVEKGLMNISYFYNRDIHETISRIQAMVEPILTLALGLLLGGLMMAVLGPIYDLLGTVGSSMIYKNAKHVLYISGHGLMAVSSGASQARIVSGYFENPEAESTEAQHEAAASVRAFESWLVDRQRDEFILLIDSVDEVIVKEELPRLGWKDRQALLTRRLSQHFRESEFTAVSIFSTKRDGKSVSVARMSALKNVVALEPWLDIMLRMHIRIQSITSPTLLATQVVNQFGPRKSGLIVSMNPAGLRQTVIQDGEVSFSRLATLSDRGQDEVFNEVTRSMQYMLMSQQVQRDLIRAGKFEIWLVTSNNDDWHDIPGKLFIDQSAQSPVRLYDLNQQGIAELPGQPGLSLWADLSLGSLKVHYGNKRLTRFSKLARLQNALVRGSAALALVGATMILSVDWFIKVQSPPMLAHERMMSQYEVERQKLEEQTGKYPVSAGEMRGVVDISIGMLGRNIDPQNILELIAKSMPENQGLSVDTISWAPVDRAYSMAAHGTAPSAAVGENVGNQAASSSGSILMLNGHVDPSWSKRYANEQTVALAQRINQICQCSIARLRLPYDPAPHVSLVQEYGSYAAKPRSFQIEMRTADAADWRFNGLPTGLANELSTSLMLQSLQ